MSQVASTGCTMEIICYGTQYRQNSHIWGVDLTPSRPRQPVLLLSQTQNRGLPLALRLKILVFQQSRSAGWVNDLNGICSLRFSRKSG